MAPRGIRATRMRRGRIALVLGWALAFLGLAAVGPADEPAEGVKIHNIERLNTADDEDYPCVAPNNLMMVFVRKKENRPTEIFAAVRRTVSQPFANPVPVEELNSGSDSSSPFPMPREPDGSEYIFFSTKGEANNLDIYFTRRLRPTEPYQRIAKAPVHQVCTEEDESDPWVSADSREMYFSRRTKDGWRIGYARGSAPRSFENVQLLSIPPGFRRPWLSRDGLTMYLQGPVMAGDSRPTEADAPAGLYVAKRASRNGPWGEPKPLAVLNHPQSKIGSCSPSLSPDGRFLYFASDRPGGKGGLDLYYVLVSDLKAAGY